MEMPFADTNRGNPPRVVSTITGIAAKQHLGDFLAIFTERNSPADRRVVGVDCPTRILVLLFVKDRRLQWLKGWVVQATSAPALQRTSNLITQSRLPEAAQAS